jgi:hypothetical protein
VGERLDYSVTFMGIRCGRMRILSFADRSSDNAPVLRITVFARTSPFFDGIYRVRSRLDSFFDPGRMSSIRYVERSSEKRKEKHEIWWIDEASSEVVRETNGETTRIRIDETRAYDPLAFIFRLRTITPAVDEEMVLGLMTSRGVAETVARVTEVDRIRTPLGRREAAAVVPEPKDRMLFSKSGKMVVWIERDEPHRPCRIEFDLAFGRLVAKLDGSGHIDAVDLEGEWSAWIDRER